MNILKLPTDNLYKFISLSGILLVITSIYYTTFFITELEKNQYNLDEEHEILLARLKHSESKASNVKEILDNTLPYQKGVLHKDYSKVSVYYSEGELKNLVEESEDLHLETVILRIKWKSSVEKQSKYVGDIRNTIKYLSFLIGLGFMLACYGFVLWYIRVQKPQDIQLRIDIENSNRRNKNSIYKSKKEEYRQKILRSKSNASAS